MGKRTSLYDIHLASGARIVNFGGWDMPLHYGSQIDEHHQVRRDAGMFDVSHMTIVDIYGQRTRELLRILIANDVGKLKVAGQALYTCMLNEQGGIIDDLIVYYAEETWFRLVVNAATRDKDLEWLVRQASPYGVTVRERRDLAMIAVQGPQAKNKLSLAMGETVRAAMAMQKPFTFVVVGEHFIARTGYTGEDGYELMAPAETALQLWMELVAAGVHPTGLGARDTLRLEAGMNLYGTDMDETTTPLDSGLGWTVALAPEGRPFIGRAALEMQCARGDSKAFIGLILLDKGVLRNHQKVLQEGIEVGEITSGSYSPTLERSIALARVTGQVAARYQVDMRGKRVDTKVVRPPFVRRGKPSIEL